MDTRITDSGFNDIFVGAEVMRLLQVGEITFKDPVEFQKLREVAEFLNNFTDAPTLVERALRKNPSATMKPLDLVTTYVKLRKEHLEAKEKIKSLEKELGYYE